MKTRVVVKQVFVRRDERGWVFEPLDSDLFAVQQNAHVVLTEPGCVRGNHFHIKGTETLTVCGPALVRLRDGTILEEITVSEGEVIRLTIPPGVTHAIKNTGDRLNILVAFNSQKHDSDEPADVRTDILIQPDGKY